jgi:hypothetical protein
MNFFEKMLFGNGTESTTRESIEDQQIAWEIAEKEALEKRNEATYRQSEKNHQREKIRLKKLREEDQPEPHPDVSVVSTDHGKFIQVSGDTFPVSMVQRIVISHRGEEPRIVCSNHGYDMNDARKWGPNGRRVDLGVAASLQFYSATAATDGVVTITMRDSAGVRIPCNRHTIDKFHAALISAWTGQVHSAPAKPDEMNPSEVSS